MKLRNKHTGEIGKLHCDMQVKPMKIGVFEDTDIRGHYWEYNSLAELNEDWEDYEEPKEYWYIDWNGEVCRSDIHDERTEQMKLIGNYFETEEEAEKAVEKLKAWKRLKDKGFRFNGYKNDARVGLPRINWSIRKINKQVDKDLDLLFGGEE